MKLQVLKISATLLFVLFTASVEAQVAIGELPATGMEDGVIFQLESPDKGLLIPRVALTGTLDTSTIDPANVEGLWVYNTGPAGSGATSVTEGMYFWDGTRWIRIYNQGYSQQFFQTGTQKAANQSTSYSLPGLTQTISAPYSGTYQIIVVCYYASGLISSAGSPAVGTSSVWLEIDGSKVAEAFLTSNSKIVQSGGSFLALAHSSTIIYNVDLNGGQDYTFRVRAREWDQDNAFSTFLGNGYGFWGIDTTLYNGNQHTGSNGDAQDNYMTITLLRQY